MAWLRRIRGRKRRLFVRPTHRVNVYVNVGCAGKASGHLRRVRDSSTPTIIISTDLLLAGFRGLFPAERMIVFAGRSLNSDVRLTSFVDVTEPKPSIAHVRACPSRMTQALLDFERTAAQFVVWMHSHPGEGPKATHPSEIDLTQDRDLRRHFSDRLVNIIAVRDGHFRLWGQSIDRRIVSVTWEGEGIQRIEGQRDVYRLAIQ